MALTKEQVLKQYFGYDKFRPLQADIIDWVLYGQDCMVLMPTGGGKSLCFQVPALMMQGITIVISPLIALMHDQVQALQANGIPSAYINSSLSGAERFAIERQCKAGEIKLLYISPEKLFSNGYLDWIKSLQVSMVAVDESHCVSVWGHDFRPEYTQLHVLKSALPNVPFMALTATADRVTRKDVLTQLGIPEARVFISSFDRPNLSLSVQPGRNRLKTIQKFIQERPRKAGIIYCLSRKNTEQLADSLLKVGISARCYHAGMSTDERAKVQDQFLRDDIQVICATIAFGMGIDKSNVRWVMHYSLPANIESFYQEIGRAGRDGVKADTLLFYSYNDLIVRKDMLAQSELPAEMKEVQLAKLDRLKQYAEAEICRRRILLSYFNEEVDRDCGNCDVCKNPPIRFDASVLAQKALSAIARTNERIAMGMLIDILRGSNNRKIIEHRYHEIKTFGAGRDLKYEEWADYIQQMLNSGIMDIAYDEQHAFKLNNASWSVLKDGKKVQLVRFRPFEEKQAEREANAAPKEKTKREVVRDELFERLRLLRKQIADNLDIPPFVVFSDATLSDMAQKKPISPAEMLNVSGVGEQKFRQYGDAFLREIRDFIKTLGKSGGEKGDTAKISFSLYEEGLSLDEIAERRGLSPVTIVSHLVKFFEEGHPVDLRKFVTTVEFNAIAQAMKILGTKKGEPVKPVFDLLQGKYDYHKIKVVMALLDK